MYSVDFRKIAVKLYQKFNNYRKVASLLNISHSILHLWVNKGIGFKQKIATPRKLKDNVIENIKQFIEKYPICTISLIKNHLYKKHDLDISHKTISKALKNNGITKKKVCYKNIVKYPEKEAVFVENFKEIHKNREIISIDECHFAENILPLYGYALKGKRLVVKRKSLFKRKNKSLLLAISNKGYWYYKIFDGAVNKNRFNQFLNDTNFEGNSTILLDNVPFHRSNIVKETAISKKYELLYTPPYEPKYNPIEHIFFKIKNNFRKLNYYGLKCIDAIEKSINIVTEADIINCFNHLNDTINEY